ncbi:MAG: polymer-forming cytoskeletal protein [Kiloniellales bacterium]|nr:polymer-forming cytoskeletal protein [Kiloniellales bacterium]
MFSRDKSDARLLGGSSAPAAAKGGSIPSIISSDLRVVGDLRSDGDLQIDGVIEGDVESHSLTVGINAKIKGSVSADDARICGTVEGQVKAKSVIVAETARVIGDVVHEKLSVETGAYLEGNCRHMSSNRGAGNGAGPKVSLLKAEEEAAKDDTGTSGPKPNGKEGAAPIAG